MNISQTTAADGVSEALIDPSRIEHIRKVLARFGRVHIPSFLTQDAAKALYDACLATQWNIALKTDMGKFHLSPADLGVADVVLKEDIAKEMHARAGPGSYLFDFVLLSEEAEQGRLAPGAFADFFAALNSPTMIQRFRTFTGDDRVAYVDAQATRYRPGHFLTVHDDTAASRLYAYVLNLTPFWTMDWGGLLMFLGPDGHVAEAYTPAWNAFNVFKVPQPHAVSAVAPIARAARFSITGWMLSEKP